MKRTIAVMAVTVGLLGGGVAVAAPSQAVPKAWMTIGEFHKIKLGMTLKQVRKIAGSNGRQTYSSVWTEGGYCDTYTDDLSACLVYKPLTQHSSADYVWRTTKAWNNGGYIQFHDGRVMSKSFSR